jgi:hypothetical protein
MDNYVYTEGTLPSNNQPPAGNCQGGIFVPVQQNSDMWPPAEALLRGTAFPCLYSPWEKGENYDG